MAYILMVERAERWSVEVFTVNGQDHVRAEGGKDRKIVSRGFAGNRQYHVRPEGEKEHETVNKNFPADRPGHVHP
jgi:hypothetical protein